MSKVDSMCSLDDLSISPQPTLSLGLISDEKDLEVIQSDFLEDACEDECSSAIEQLKAEMKEVEDDYLTLMKIRKKLEKKMLQCSTPHASN